MDTDNNSNTITPHNIKLSSLTECLSLSSATEYVLTQGGIETTLFYKTDFPLRHFASFEVALSKQWHHLIHLDNAAFMKIACEYDVPIILDSQTWRASQNWFDKMGFHSHHDRHQVFVKCYELTISSIIQIRDKWSGHHHQPTIIMPGLIGPMDDAYHPESIPSVHFAKQYHTYSVGQLKQVGFTEIYALTITSSAEACGIALAAAEHNMPCIISFVITTTGHLPSHETLAHAITTVDQTFIQSSSIQNNNNNNNNNQPLFYMLNCIHPKYIKPVLQTAKQKKEDWLDRIYGVRANASEKTHEELDNCDILDEGNPPLWAQQMIDLTQLCPNIRILGGCCGTDAKHVEQIAKLLPSKRSTS